MEARLPTRWPTETPTATPFAVSAEAYHRRGVERQRAGDIDAARRHFTWAIQRDASFAPAYVSRASAYLAEGDLDRALQDVDAALEIERTARAYTLRGEILRAMEQYPQAWRAFEQAVARGPGLKDLTFRSRWEVALAIGDEEYLSALAAEYAADHPDDWLRYYYEGWTALEAQAYKQAIVTLVQGIEQSDDQPALLWHLLGRAYTGIEAWQEAVTSLETARELLQAGDSSMVAHTEGPVADLFLALGRAYLGAGRCVDAETMLTYGMYVGAPTAEYLAALEEARICQTPTPPPPTATPAW
jgi:tetratricopeptide (TPR) repeat protein